MFMFDEKLSERRITRLREKITSELVPCGTQAAQAWKALLKTFCGVSKVMKFMVSPNGDAWADIFDFQKV